MSTMQEEENRGMKEGEGMTFTTFSEKHPDRCTYRKCECNLCEAKFSEAEILIDDDTEEEYCPNCHEKGYIENIEGDD